MSQDTLRPLHLPRWARRRNLKATGALGFEQRLWRNRKQRLAERAAALEQNQRARLFWERCWNALAPELLAWGNSVETDAERPHQEDVDLIMGQVGALPLAEQAKFAVLSDEGIVRFVRELVKRHRERRNEAETNKGLSRGTDC